MLKKFSLELFRFEKNDQDDEKYDYHIAIYRAKKYVSLFIITFHKDDEEYDLIMDIGIMASKIIYSKCRERVQGCDIDNVYTFKLPQFYINKGLLRKEGDKRALNIEKINKCECSYKWDSKEYKRICRKCDRFDWGRETDDICTCSYDVYM